MGPDVLPGLLLNIFLTHLIFVLKGFKDLPICEKTHIFCLYLGVNKKK